MWRRTVVMVSARRMGRGRRPVRSQRSATRSPGRTRSSPGSRRSCPAAITTVRRKMVLRRHSPVRYRSLVLRWQWILRWRRRLRRRRFQLLLLLPRWRRRSVLLLLYRRRRRRRRRHSPAKRGGGPGRGYGRRPGHSRGSTVRDFSFFPDFPVLFGHRPLSSPAGAGTRTARLLLLLLPRHFCTVAIGVWMRTPNRNSETVQNGSRTKSAECLATVAIG